LYEYKALIYNVVDGDTMDFEIDLGFGIRYEGRLRLYGVNTPEVRGPEKERGLIVKEYVRDLLEGHEVVLQTVKWKGKYGRYIAKVMFEERISTGDSGTIPVTTLTNLSDHLVHKGMAKYVDY